MLSSTVAVPVVFPTLTRPNVIHSTVASKKNHISITQSAGKKLGRRKNMAHKDLVVNHPGDRRRRTAQGDTRLDYYTHPVTLFGNKLTYGQEVHVYSLGVTYDKNHD